MSRAQRIRRPSIKTFWTLEAYTAYHAMTLSTISRSLPPMEMAESFTRSTFFLGHKHLRYLGTGNICSEYASGCLLRSKNVIVKAGLAEQLDPQILMYWMTHHFCRLIHVSLKTERPAASREDILWNILDRWGFPIVRAVHALKASLCRLDHGLAMLLGISHRRQAI